MILEIALNEDFFNSASAHLARLQFILILYWQYKDVAHTVNINYLFGRRLIIYYPTNIRTKSTRNEWNVCFLTQLERKALEAQFFAAQPSIRLRSVQAFCS